MLQGSVGGLVLFNSLIKDSEEVAGCLLAKFAGDANARVPFNAFKAQGDSKRRLGRLEVGSNLLKFKQDERTVLLLERSSPGTSTGCCCLAGGRSAERAGGQRAEHQPTVPLAATMAESCLGRANGQRQSPPGVIVSLYTAPVRRAFNTASSSEPPGRREIPTNLSVGFGFTKVCHVVGHLMLPTQNIFFFPL